MVDTTTRATVMATDCQDFNHFGKMKASVALTTASTHPAVAVSVFQRPTISKLFSPPTVALVGSRLPFDVSIIPRRRLIDVGFLGDENVEWSR